MAIHHSYYRGLWEKHNGPIPVDEDGRSYEIHHIDGNRENNDLDNLICVSIREHYEIHKKQGDYAAAAAVYRRMCQSPEEFREVQSDLMKKFMNRPEMKEWCSRESRKRWQDPEYAEKMRKVLGDNSRKRVKEGTHEFLDPEFHKKYQPIVQEKTRERVAKGEHNFQTKEMSAISSERAKKRNSVEYVCPHCGKKGKGVVMKRHHFDRCKKLGGANGSDQRS